VFLAIGLLSVAGYAQEAVATSVEVVATPDLAIGGELIATVDGTKQKIADSAIDGWIIDRGKSIVYTDRDGAGGFENEGQSLKIYDVRYKTTRKILSESVGIVAVGERKLSNGRSVLFVRMEDGGLGGSYFAVVDPKRGEVFYRRWAELVRIDGDMITLAFYREGDWERINEDRPWNDSSNKNVIPKRTKVRPVKTERHDLKALLKREVIYNRPDYLDQGDGDRSQLVEAKIYFWRADDDTDDPRLVLSPVKRLVNKTSPLRSALEELFKGAMEDERSNGFSDSTFGMKFEGVTLAANGMARIKFSQPPDKTNYGSLGPFILLEAIERTARQFPAVRRVEICAVGETMIDSELEKPIPRCGK
jgi:hypothetical protein